MTGTRTAYNDHQDNFDRFHLIGNECKRLYAELKTSALETIKLHHHFLGQIYVYSLAVPIVMGRTA